ncbi:hypothetical protein [Solibacillus isronensis]|uniref:hypothetical protein n=1 Tax=Solibacillus isronensis TaxID=412383 RepID=UPI00399F1E9C
MKLCERCNQDKELFPEGFGLCEECCNEMLLGAPSSSFDWSQIDFEKGDFK